MRKNNFLKKSLAMILSLAMVAPILGYLQVNVNEVQAEETAVTGDIPEDVIGYEIVPANVVDTTGSQPTIVSTDETYGEFADYLFAGWYTDKDATTPAEYGKTGSYARFVPADVLSIKCQVTNGVVTETDIDKYRGKYVMRFVSSVDSLDYIQVGFELNSEGWEKEKTATSKSVYSRIESTTGSTEKGRDTYSFSSKVIDTKSEYFITAKYPIAVDDIDVNYTVRAFWVTQDGTKVYGADRCVSVSDGADTILNLSVPAELDETANTYTATYTNADGTTVSNAAVKVLTSGAANSNVRITVPDKNLKSVTEVTIMKGTEKVTSTLYRNLYTEYNGTPDTSWYDLQTGEEEFVIATNADLYGFAAVVNDSANDEAKKLANKTVYLVSDISANPQDFVNDPTDANNLKWYNAEAETYGDAPTYQWNPIGYCVSEGEYNSFCGTFDGGMHTISNIYYNGRTDSLNAQYAGLFGPLSGGTATIKNLKLKDSYFNNGSRTYVGSISGCASGTFMNIYSNAYVENAAAVVGGLFGGTTGGTDNPVDLSGCWFDGNVVSSKTSVGAMFGHLTDAEVTMSDCLITGDVNSSYTSPSNPNDVLVYAGGYAGVIESSSLSIKDCLNVGSVSVVSGKRDGLITGAMRGTNSSVDIDSSYAMSNKYSYVIAYAATASTLKIGDKTYSLAAGKDVRHWHTASNGADVSGIKKAEADMLGTVASSSLTGFDFNSTWSTILTGNPVPKVFKTELVDTTWYVDGEDTFTLYDRADLYGFAELSQENDFAGKTVKLGDDIVVNTNYNATTWATTAPKYSWLPISNSELPFAGTFDGGMHSIKGIYLNTTSANAGLFSVTGATSLIQNLYLEDSYFNSTASNLGSIAGQADGMFDTVKSTAVVNYDSAKTTATVNTGGLIGLGKGQNLILRYCWFDGTVSTAARATGGIMGALYNDENYGSSVVMENCLSSGTMDLKSSNHGYLMAGGFIGMAGTGTAKSSVNANVRFERCLYTGEVNNIGSNLPGIFIGRLRDADIVCNYSYGKKATNMTNEHVISYLDGDATFISPYVLNGKTYTDNPRTTVNLMRVQAYITQGSSVNSVFTGEGAKANLVSLDFTNTWSVAEGEYPVLNFANASETSDKRWYHADATEMILYDRADLYGFAALSQTNQFSGKTIKLGKDIVVNADYDVDAWMKAAPKYVWTPIGTKAKPFAGTFDGQSHSISGIYSNPSDTATHNSGLFTFVQKGTVKNLKLEDSLICGNVLMGSIAGQFNGSTLLNVYSNADVIGNCSNMGGLLGMVAGANMTSTIERCWFDGNVTNQLNTEASERGTGGLVGTLKQYSLNMVNCLNTGVIDVTAYQAGTYINPRVGGLIGGASRHDTYTISQCLNAGKVNVHSDAAGSYGPIIGYTSIIGMELISETYATTGSCKRFDLSVNVAYESITQVAEADIKGDAAKKKINFLNYADTCWVCVEGGFPEIDFASTNAGTTIDVSVTDTDTTQLATLYSASDTPYALYQGELHAHADTITSGGQEDGTVSLATWETQMQKLDLDFAATLDHHQTTQYDNEKTYPGLFIYGTEAGTYITDQKPTGEAYGRKLHYNMIFSQKSELESVLKSKSGFNYSSSSGTFSYPDFTQKEFQELIQSVRNNNGLFILAHPFLYTTEEPLSDFHYADWIGFEVIYGNITNDKWGKTNIYYRAWKQLLADGAKMWACSGSDTHEDLKDTALTSVYSSGKGQSYYMNQLTVGNFTAGSVGIQMCMGDTVMGKECDFTGQRLVVQVGELHKSVYDATHKYRVDVLNDKGVVYSRNLTVGEDMIPTNGTIALDAQDCKFYRVEVFDATTNTRIAIGNPIWNSTK